MPIAAGIYYFLFEGGGTRKPSLVLIHGAGGDHLSWPPEIRRLAYARTFTLDLPGHGKSKGPGRQSVAEYSKNVIGFLDSAGISRAVIIGHSLGGAIALDLCSKNPDRVAGIGLISSGVLMPIPRPVMDNAANPATFNQAVQSFQELMHISPGAHQLRIQTFKRLSSLRQALFLGDLQACDQYDGSEQLGIIRCPVLVVCGTNDHLTPLRYSQNLARSIPGAALQTIDGGGHLVILEQPRRVAGLIDIFLKSIPTSFEI